MSERDLFANFERMRREMDQLFGDVFERAGMARRRVGFMPAVDVARGPENKIREHQKTLHRPIRRRRQRSWTSAAAAGNF